MNRYGQMAQYLNMTNAKVIGPDDVCFDLRAILKCRWGCEDFFHPTIKCHTRDTTLQK